MFSQTVFLDVKHWTSPYEEYYDYDHRIRATLKIYINEIFFGGFRHPKNTNTDTHTENGNPNPNFKGDYLVTATCDDHCACQVSKENY